MEFLAPIRSDTLEFAGDDYNEAVRNAVDARQVDIYWDSGDDTGKLSASVFATDAAADSATDWTRSIVETTPPNNGSSTISTPHLRVACPTGLTGSNTRIFLPITGSTSVDSEVRSTWLAHTTGSQCGHFHRLVTKPATTHPYAYVAWHDALFQIDSIVNMNTWENDVENNQLIQGSSNDSGVADLTAIQKLVEVYASSKNGTAVVLTVPRGHGIIAGDNLMVYTTMISGEAATVTSVEERTISYTSGTSAATPIPVAGPGSILSRRAIFPLNVASRLVGTTLRVKLWSVGAGEPDWSSSLNALTFNNIGSGPTGSGTAGLMVAHLATDAAYAEFGSVHWRNLDA